MAGFSVHIACQGKNFLSKQTPESSTRKQSTRGDALNVSLVATRGTGVLLGHTAGTTSTPREKLSFVRVPLCLNPSGPARDITLGRIVPGGVAFILTVAGNYRTAHR